ncbi:DUF4123 domain-containing protein [[Pseudomonas] boreopolis]|uniref:DUF4123 domain-containing protein n=1 Tax=Xanthomonas boreopolis TaxID=86183 RepID=UPI003D9B9A8C
MSDLFPRWNESMALVVERVPGSTAYVLMDAAQLPPDVMPWMECIRHGQVWNVSEDEPEADHPEVCALLAPHEAAWIATLLENYLPRRPFAFVAIASVRPVNELVAGLSWCKHAALPDGKNGLLRFYDAAVLQMLPEALDGKNLAKVLACADAWMHVQRDGSIGVLQGGGRPGMVALSPRELNALDELGTVDRVLATLGKHGRLPVEADPFDAYGKLSLMATTLFPDGKADMGVLYRCGAVCLGVPMDDFCQQWTQNGPFARLRGRDERLFEVVSRWAEGYAQADEAWPEEKALV